MQQKSIYEKDGNRPRYSVRSPCDIHSKQVLSEFERKNPNQDPKRLMTNKWKSMNESEKAPYFAKDDKLWMAYCQRNIEYEKTETYRVYVEKLQKWDKQYKIQNTRHSDNEEKEEKSKGSVAKK